VAGKLSTAANICISLAAGTAVVILLDAVSGVGPARLIFERFGKFLRLEIARSMDNVFLNLLLFVLPLSVDTFAIAAAVGASRLTGSTRWRISAVFVIFEGGMPLVGLALGASIGHTVGSVADYLSGGLLVLLGGYLWWADDDDEVAKARRLTSTQGLALVGLALSISLDELAIGFSLGLGASFTIPATIVAVIAIQTLVVSQLGLSFSVWISERLRECIERLAGPMLIVLGIYLLAEALIHIRLVITHHAVAIGMLILGAITIGARCSLSAWVRAVSSRHPRTPWTRATSSAPLDRVSAPPQAAGSKDRCGVLSAGTRPATAAVVPSSTAIRK
jgi:putative Mn2+ efflux pump MntP